MIEGFHEIVLQYAVSDSARAFIQQKSSAPVAKHLNLAALLKHKKPVFTRAEAKNTIICGAVL